MAYARLPNSNLPGRGLKQTPSANGDAGVLAVTLDVDIATKTSLGIVQIGDGINITPEGVISCDCHSVGGCSTTTVSEDYECSDSDCYIGVNSSGPVSISLPVDSGDGKQIAVKAQMGPPLGNRKVTINTLDGSLIDNEPTYVITIPYESVHIIRNGFNWWVI